MSLIWQSDWCRDRTNIGRVNKVSDSNFSRSHFVYSCCVNKAGTRFERAQRPAKAGYYGSLMTQQIERAVELACVKAMVRGAYSTTAQDRCPSFRSRLALWRQECTKRGLPRKGYGPFHHYGDGALCQSPAVHKLKMLGICVVQPVNGSVDAILRSVHCSLSGKRVDLTA